MACDIGYHPEEELLLCCARKSISPEVGERIQALASESLDWNNVLQKASKHRIRPLLLHHLQRICPQSIPQESLKSLQNAVYKSTRHNLLLNSALAEIARLMDSEGILMIPLKGPALAQGVYGDITLRETTDLDLMVRRQDIPRAQELLTRLKYFPKHPTEAGNEYHNLFTRTDGRVLVELHWGMQWCRYASLLDADALSDELQVLLSGAEGCSIKVLSPENLFLLLCMHGTNHFWLRLQWIADIAELLLTHPQMDWDLILEKANTWGSSRMIPFGIYLVQDLLKIPVPDSIQRNVLHDPSFPLLAEIIRKNLFTLPVGAELNYPESFKFLWQLSNQFSIKRQVLSRHWYLYFKEAITPHSTDYESIKLPDQFKLLYYLIRPGRLMLKYSKEAALHLFNRP